MGMDDTCARCSGTGTISGHPCEKCHGSKVITEEACVYFTVSLSNYKRKAIVLEGEGHQIGLNLFGNILISLDIELSDYVRIEDDYFCVYSKVLPVQRIIGDKAEVGVFGRALPYVIEKGETEAWVEDLIRPGLTQKVRISFIPLQPHITDETQALYKKILEIEKANFNDHHVRI